MMSKNNYSFHKYPLQGNRGSEETIFLLLYPFRPLANIQAIISNFACEMTNTYF